MTCAGLLAAACSSDQPTNGTGGAAGSSSSGGSGSSTSGGGGSAGSGGGGSAGSGGSPAAGAGGSSGAGGTGAGIDAGSDSSAAGSVGQMAEAGGGGAGFRDAASEAGAGAPAETGACPGAGRSLHFQDDLNGASTTSTQVLADLGADLPIGNTARTVEMWLYMEGNESWKSGHSIIEYGGVARCQAFGIDGGDSQTANPPQFDPFTFSGGSTCAGDNNVPIAPTPMRTGWLHVAYAYDPAGLGGVANVNFAFTVNGVAQAIPAVRQTGPLLTMRTVVSIGSGQDASADTGNGFTGKIDEVRIWNVGRTVQQIADNHRLILRGDEPGLVAYYHFDDGAGTAPHDASTKHHDAVFASNGGRPAPTWVDSTGLTLMCAP